MHARIRQIIRNGESDNVELEWFSDHNVADFALWLLGASPTPLPTRLKGTCWVNLTGRCQLEEGARVPGKWHEYSITVPAEQSYYGTDCTAEDARQIAGRLAELIAESWPGVHVSVAKDAPQSQRISGPDASTIYELQIWIDQNWHLAPANA